MTNEEFLAGVEAIKRRADIEIKKLRYQYVAENALYRIGEIIYDADDRIRVEHIRFSLVGTGSTCPVIYYEGPKVKKNGEPFKSGAWATVFEQRAHKDEA